MSMGADTNWLALARALALSMADSASLDWRSASSASLARLRVSSCSCLTWKIVDRVAFIRGVIDGTIPPEMLEIHSVNMNAMWKMNKGKVKEWPGVEVVDGVSIRGRG